MLANTQHYVSLHTTTHVPNNSASAHTLTHIHTHTHKHVHMENVLLFILNYLFINTI